MDAALRPTGASIIGVGSVEDGDRSTAVSPTEHTDDRFEIGSITKAVTGLVLARLVLDGATSLDSPVGGWLDSGDNSTITLEELAIHTSGLPRLAPNARDHEGFDAANPYGRYDAELAEAGLRSAALEDRGTYAYSNFGYQLLGLCLERITGRPLCDLFDEYVLKPAGMSTATADPDQPVLQGEDESGPVANWTLLLQGPGGINATIDDLLALVAAVLRPADGEFAKAVAFALESRADGPGAGVGLGWLLHPAGIACCGGGTGGFSTYVAGHMNTGRGVAIALNRSAPGIIQDVALAAAQGRDPAPVVRTPFEGDREPWARRALELFHALAALDFEGARRLMTSETADALTADRLSGGWSHVAGACGTLDTATVTDVARAKGAVEVTVVAEGAVKPLTLKAWLDPERRVAGVTIQ
jgi:CubicO group peptidase (beta-lactamase class C family)